MKPLYFKLANILIKENYRSIRRLAKKANLPYLKTKRLVFKMRKEKLINRINTLLTDKGLSEYEKHRVKNAIIFADNIGRSFVPLTYTKQRGLININGETIIERQIRFLKEKDINSIYLVVGHLKEQYQEIALKHNINLVINEDYALGSLSSLIASKDLLSNTYIISSALYLKENIFNTYEDRSFICYTNYKELDSLNIELDKHNKIISVNTDKKKNKSLEGLTYFDEFTSNNIKPLLQKINQNTGNYKPFLAKHIKNLGLYAKTLDSSLVQRVNSLEQLRKLDRQYLLNSKDKILSLITSILQCSEDKIINIESMKNGLTNKSFVFTYDSTRYIFRLPGEGSELFINRSDENESYNSLKSLKFTDTIVYFDPSKGYKIAKFLDSYRSCDPYDENDTINAMKVIKKLHKANIKVKHVFDFRERINYMENLAIKNNGKFYSDYNELKESINKILDILESFNIEKCLCHVDCLADNVLTNGSDYRLIDWEYSGMADPLSDIAQYISFKYQSDEDVDKIFKIYLEREPSYQEKLRLYGYISLVGFFWAAWGIYKTSIGFDIGEYGNDLYKYAQRYSPKFFELYQRKEK